MHPQPKLGAVRKKEVRGGGGEVDKEATKKKFTKVKNGKSKLEKNLNFFKSIL